MHLHAEPTYLHPELINPETIHMYVTENVLNLTYR
jgi:hypothetical protein